MKPLRFDPWLSIGLLISFGLAAIIFGGDSLWVGYSTISLEFQVVDAKTGQSIEGALVELTERDPELRATTGSDGKMTLVGQFMVGGRSSLFRRTRHVNYGCSGLRVSAAGHRTFVASLDHFTSGARYHSDSQPPLIVISVEPDASGLDARSTDRGAERVSSNPD